ncbi:hypothetical protein F0562_013954 [Nyssa sinensis]|uniref:Reverse transcriptase RNase H-like domain-containing protein n=1 Tax=Nyssa sinensis TaxID=561372 RepID=A0A5J4ZR94_9ASTE|nr:hypothetical protein F0562_013954 [Nyssa sinensis]
MGFDFVIEYKKGPENIVADALSRREDDAREAKLSGELAAISQPVSNWVAAIKEEINSKTDLQDLVQQIQGDEAVGLWKLVDGMIFFKERAFLAVDSPLIPDIIEQFHNSSYEGAPPTLLSYIPRATVVESVDN